MKVELKTCPFCGGEAYIDYYKYVELDKTLLGKTYIVRCGECDVESAEYHSEAEDSK